MKNEHYIPFSNDFLLQKLISTKKFNNQELKELQKLVLILEHYFHYENFEFIQKIKRNYALFDPDKTVSERLEYDLVCDINTFKDNLLALLSKGNYHEIEQHVLEKALQSEDLIGLRLKINFDDFKEYKFFARGFHSKTEEVPFLIFWKKKVDIEYYERVIVYLQYKTSGYYEEKKISTEQLPFNPGTISIKMFKRVPKNDLETVFPNAIPKMSLKDKLLLWIPAIGGGIPLISAKVIPPLLAMYAAYRTGEILNLDKSKTSLIQGLIALGVLAAYLFRHYSNYKSKKIKFSKLLSDNLYFKNLANNSGVFPALTDSSESEELKETVLAYVFLLQSQKPLTALELDEVIENWFRDTLNVKLDFDVEDALFKLEKLGLGKNNLNRWEVLPLEKALIKVDEIWDNIFNYNN